MTIEQILEIVEKYKLRMPPTAFYELKADIVNFEEPTTKNNLGVDCISRQSVLDKIQRLIDAEQNNIDEHGDYMNYARERVNAYEAVQFFVENDCLCPSVTPQESILDKIRAEIEPKCDRINSLASVLPYTAHREIQELLCEIMDLCKAESEDT